MEKLPEFSTGGPRPNARAFPPCLDLYGEVTWILSANRIIPWIFQGGREESRPTRVLFFWGPNRIYMRSHLSGFLRGLEKLPECSTRWAEGQTDCKAVQQWRSSIRLPNIRLPKTVYPKGILQVRIYRFKKVAGSRNIISFYEFIN